MIRTLASVTMAAVLAACNMGPPEYSWDIDWRPDGKIERLGVRAHNGFQESIYLRIDGYRDGVHLATVARPLHGAPNGELHKESTIWFLVDGIDSLVVSGRGEEGNIGLPDLGFSVSDEHRVEYIAEAEAYLEDLYREHDEGGGVSY